VELLVGGRSHWYPVDLPAMEVNTHYQLSGLTLLGPGSEGPDIPVSRAEAVFSVSVEPWGTQYTITEES
jgi:hypothetical protein